MSGFDGADAQLLSGDSRSSTGTLDGAVGFKDRVDRLAILASDSLQTGASRIHPPDRRARESQNTRHPDTKRGRTLMRPR